ncbi:MAG: type II toxin-antitoxin system HicB family antitoxin [Acidimicrobiales bacterium]
MSKIAGKKTYRATVQREPGWWIVTVPELDLVTQARRVRDIQHMATDLVAAWLDADPADVRVELEDSRRQLQSSTSWTEPSAYSAKQHDSRKRQGDSRVEHGARCLGRSSRRSR